MEAEASAQHGVGIFKPARQRVIGLNGEVIGELALQQAAIDPVAANRDAQGRQRAGGRRAGQVRQQRQHRFCFHRISPSRQ